ncbi:MAG: hypothetical protein PGN22_02330 [Agrobacterium cavarae]|uniref:hypothetical protein n=1 Tax=Agrobacterium cavarae TaxID=2528239 RepID=UPI00305C50C1
MSEKELGKSEMSSVESFCQNALQSTIAPLTIGSVKARITHAAWKLGWSISRTKDAWYADPRISIDGAELTRVEEVSGLTYAKRELQSLDDLIAKAEALLDGPEADFHRPFVDAFRAFIGALNRS